MAYSGPAFFNMIPKELYLPGNVFWSGHGANYYLFLVNKSGKLGLLIDDRHRHNRNYDYFVTFEEPFTFDPEFNFPLDRCCTEYLGKVGARNMVCPNKGTHNSGSLLQLVFGPEVMEAFFPPPR